MRKEKYFHDLKIDWKDTIVILDVDGTLVCDGFQKMGKATVKKLRELKAKNTVYLCSNSKDDARNKKMAQNIGIEYLQTPFRKPSRRMMKWINNPEGKTVVVIGDKWLTDGLFARRIRARFIRVQRMKSNKEPLWIKWINWMDDVLYKWMNKSEGAGDAF